MVARSIVTVPQNRMVPVKILNPTDKTVVIHRNKALGYFQVLDDNSSIKCKQVDSSFDTVHYCNHAKVKSGQHTALNKGVSSNNLETDKNRFMTYFQFDQGSLSNTEKFKLENCLFENRDIFVTDENPSLGLTNLVEHHIHLRPDAKSKHQRPYKLTPEKRAVLRHQLDELLNQGVITPVSEKEDIPITSPIVLVAKRNKPSSSGQHKTKQDSLSMYRFCVDFRYLNTQTQDFRYAIPDVQELTESFADMSANYMSSVDLSSGFFQMKLAPESAKYTAFNTCYGTYKFQRTPQGMKTSPHSFQLLIDKVLKGLSFKTTLCYMDDVVIVSPTFSQHIDDLNDVFSRLRAAGLKLSPTKCKFTQNKCVFLGHEISREGIRPPADRLKAIANYPFPNTVKALQRFLGLMNWFRKFIPGYSIISSCLYTLLKKNEKFTWLQEHQSAYEKLKQILQNSDALAFPRYDLPFYLAVDTSSKGIGYMLYQKHPANDSTDHTIRVVRFGSKSLNKYQQSYGPTKLELLGMVTSILDCASYLRGRHFFVECDHQSLKPLFQKQMKGAIYERWLAILQEFDCEIIYKQASEMTVPDALSRCFPNENAEQLEFSPEENDPCFPYIQEKQTCVRLPDGKTLKELLCNSQQEISRLIVNHAEVKSSLEYVREEDNYDADTEDYEIDECFRTKDPSQLRQKEIYVSDNLSANYTSTLTESESEINAYNTNTESMSLADQNAAAHTLEIFEKFDFSIEKVKELQRTDPELSSLIQYLDNNELPKGQKKARRILLESTDYVIIDGLLMHSRQPKSNRAKLLDKYQLVVPTIMIKEVVQLYHDTPMSGHSGIHDTLDRLREKYFFKRMGPIVTDYVRSCDHCQKRKISKQATKAPVTAYPTPTEPFQVWQVDLYGPLPVTRQGYTYVLTAIDMFSKYVVTIPIANKDTLSVSSALVQIFTKYGVCDTD